FFLSLSVFLCSVFTCTNKDSDEDGLSYEVGQTPGTQRQRGKKNGLKCTTAASGGRSNATVLHSQSLNAEPRVPAYWVIPSGVTKVEGEVGFKIDFTSAAAKKKNLDKAINGDGNHQQGLRTCSAPSAFASRVEPPTEQDMKVFRERLSKAGDNAIALSLVPEHCNSFRDPVKPTPAPKSLKAVRNTKLDNADYSTLLEYCDKIKDCANMTPEQASKLERKTREQSKCEEWFAARAGRVTASQLHAVCHTSIESPSKTTVSSVCYPQRNCASTKPGDPRHWGITQEETARHQYTAVMAESHVGFCAEKCGLFVNPEFPYIGASPDGLVKCTCCGSGCLEVKCPFKHKLKTVRQACQEDKTFCLQFDQGKFTMKKNHRFYAQVQCQIFVTNTEFCDFVVWTEKDLCIVRVEPDPEFFSAQRERAKIFFEKVALPELVAKHFSRCHINCKPIASAHPSSKVTKSKTKPVSSGASASQQPQPRLPLCSSPGKMNTAKTKEVTQKRALSISPTKKRSPVKRGSRSLKTLWCYCRRTEEEDDMVACDNENCEVKWFHLSCVGLQCIPREDDAWFCPTCDQQTH
ncbi:hypothetical protein BaRGS_00013437, partial [Batillaria attramentaria]